MREPNGQTLTGGKRRGWLRWAQWVVAGGLIVVLIRVVGLRELALKLSGLDLRWVLATTGLSLFLLALGGVNVWLLLRALAPVKLGDYLPAYVLGWAAGLVVPGQIGDATQVLLLRARGVAVSGSAAAYALDKGVTLVVFLLVAVAGGARYLDPTHARLSGVALMGAVVVGVGALGLILVWRAARSRGRLGRVAAALCRVLENMLSFRRRPLCVARNGALTVGKWVVMAACYYAAFRAVGAEISATAAGVIPVMSTLVGYLPVTAGGIGTVEWSAVFLFGRAGTPESVVVAAYVLLRLVQYTIALPLAVLATRRMASAERSCPSTREPT
ncbi:MAG: flippase-like domain-containing protein [Deltaproteobacteria bacterium]|nr:flippase-like domain-containing protein [Deltaproteobacteria bacterium]